MRQEWINDGEPDENGDIKAVLKNDSGGIISTFIGKSMREVADKVLTSQIKATEQISKLQRPDRANRPAPIAPRDTTILPADRMRLANELSDPSTVVEAVTEIVTAANGGIPIRATTQNVATMTQEQRDAYFLAEAEAFRVANPLYYPVPQNSDKVFGALEKSGWDLTRNNLGIVFQTLYDQGEMIDWPDEEEQQQHEPAPTNGQQRPAPPAAPSPSSNSRPRSIATGLRTRDASAQRPAPAPPKKLTRAEIESMPRAEYEAKLRDPEFRRQVDALSA